MRIENSKLLPHIFPKYFSNPTSPKVTIGNSIIHADESSNTSASQFLHQILCNNLSISLQTPTPRVITCNLSYPKSFSSSEILNSTSLLSDHFLYSVEQNGPITPTAWFSLTELPVHQQIYFFSIYQLSPFSTFFFMLPHNISNTI